MDDLISREAMDSHECVFCKNHEPGDWLYESSDWDGGIGFDYVNNIQYCSICGKKLKTYEEKMDERRKKEAR